MKTKSVQAVFTCFPPKNQLTCLGVRGESSSRKAIAQAEELARYAAKLRGELPQGDGNVPASRMVGTPRRQHLFSSFFMAEVGNPRGVFQSYQGRRTVSIDRKQKYGKTQHSQQKRKFEPEIKL